jgi:serine/threonine protein kinase
VRYTLDCSYEKHGFKVEETFVALRYQRQTLYSESSGVKTHQGLDPLTGLPVLIYEFAGKPDPALADLESENIPGVLETLLEGGNGQVVVAYSRGYTVASRPLKMPALRFVLEGAQALSDAARAGVIHGDLRPERFLIGGNHVLVEGFGISWVSTPHPYSPPEGVASYAGDVYAFGKIMQELAPDLPVPMKTLLDRCLARKPEDRPSAAQLLTALVALQPTPAEQIPNAQPVPVQPSFSFAQPQASQSVQSTPNIQPTPSAQPTPNQKVLEIDFTVSEPEPPPAPPVSMPPVNLPSTKPNTLPDMPELDLFPDDSPAVNVPTLKQPMALDNWEDEVDDGLLLETDPGRAPSASASVTSKSSISNSAIKPVLPSKTSGKLPEASPKRPDAKTIDPKQTFIKDLPPGGTYKAGKTADVSSVPFKETPMAPTFDEVFLKGNKPSKNTLRIVMVVSLLLGALVLAGLVFFGTDAIRPAPTEPTSAASYIVSVNVDPPSSLPLDLLVVSSPEGSKFRAGAVVSKVPGQIVLDKPGTWQFQARFQDILSQPVTLQSPEQYDLTIPMPNLLSPVEGEETPEDGTTTAAPTTTEGQ